MPRLELDIIVKLENIKEGAYGYCLAVADDGGRPDRPRTFEIELHNKMTLRKTLETLAHEMVHVKQYARGELYQSTQKGMHRWQGKWIKNDPDYWDCPWEWEAMGREAALFIQYVEANGYNNYKWTLENMS